MTQRITAENNHGAMPKPDHHSGPWGRGPGPRAKRGLTPLDVPLQKKIGERKEEKKERVKWENDKSKEK